MYPSPVSDLENTSFFRDDVANLSSALLKEDDPGEAGERNRRTQAALISVQLLVYRPVNAVLF